MSTELQKKLLSSCDSLDSSKCAEFVKAYSRCVFAICFGMLGNIHDAEDIAQETLLKGISNIGQVQNEGLFGAWIIQIAKNLCIDFIRKQKRRKNAFYEQITTNQNESTKNPELEIAMAKLPENYRITLMLYYFDGRNIRTLAETLMISEAAALTRLSRARKQLRKILEAEGGI